MVLMWRIAGCKDLTLSKVITDSEQGRLVYTLFSSAERTEILNVTMYFSCEVQASVYPEITRPTNIKMQ